MASTRVCGHALIACMTAVGGLSMSVSIASAQPEDATVPDTAPPLMQVAAPTAETADPAAVSACALFAAVLDATAVYYGEFADAIEGTARPDYSDPAVSSSNVTGRTALRQGAGTAAEAANTPGLAPDITEPMRMWSRGATKLVVKMGLRAGRDSLDVTATELNNDALAVQTACAAAGTHA